MEACIGGGFHVFCVAGNDVHVPERDGVVRGGHGEGGFVCGVPVDGGDGAFVPVEERVWLVLRLRRRQLLFLDVPQIPNVKRLVV